ncbi:MAG: hypothetical protein WBV78_21085, partial [Roseobacter sp.]
HKRRLRAFFTRSLRRSSTVHAPPRSALRQSLHKEQARVTWFFNRKTGGLQETTIIFLKCLVIFVGTETQEPHIDERQFFDSSMDTLGLD